jgi:nucleotide-binding universal stress UspA family protein
MYKSILIATDGSATAARALEHGLGLARSLDAAVLIVAVSEKWTGFEIAAERRARIEDPISTYEREIGELAREILSSAAAVARSHGIEPRVMHVADRDAADGVLEAAQQEGCDLIVVGSHGRRGLTAMMLGSVATEIVTRSKTPVLVCR